MITTNNNLAITAIVVYSKMPAIVTRLQ